MVLARKIYGNMQDSQESAELVADWGYGYFLGQSLKQYRWSGGPV